MALRIAVLDDPVAVNSVFSSNDGGTVLEKGLAAVVQTAYPAVSHIEVSLEPMRPWRELASGLSSGTDGWARDTELVIVTNRDAIDAWPTEDIEDARRQLEAIADYLAQRSGGHLVVFNTSTVDPADNVHTYKHGTDTRPIRIHRHNLALIEVSKSHNISIVDVDAITGQLGTAQHAANGFSASALEAFRDTLMDIIEGRGLLHTGAAWNSENAAHARLVVPRFWDPRVTSGLVSKWHKTEGSELRTGERIFDLSVSDLGHKLNADDGIEQRGRLGRQNAAERAQRAMTITVKAGSPGYLQTTIAAVGEQVRIGETVGVISNHPGQAAPDEVADLRRFWAAAEVVGT